MISLTRDRIDSQALLDRVTTPAAGAVVLFLGTVRELTAGRRTIALDYEAYPEMAERKLSELEAEARRRWPLVEVAVVHRLGRLELAEASVAVAVSSPHRGAAFEAGRWLIDTLKEVVPVWKQENWVDGTKEWVHPGMEPGAASICSNSGPKSDVSHPPFPIPHAPVLSERSESNGPLAEGRGP